MKPDKNTGHRSGKKRIAWHPAFCAAAEFDLRENKDDLIYDPEHQLSKEPLKMDLLIIKKRKDAVIKNAIGHFFRDYNILEYKGPGSAFNIKHFHKTLAYAHLYIALEKNNPVIMPEQLTVSMIREAYPRKLIADLSKMGIAVHQTAPGIYALDETKILFPAQIVVTKDLSPETGAGLRILSKNIQLSDLEAFFKAAENAKDPEEKNNISAILYASGCANKAIFKEAMEVVTMPEFFEELLKDRIEAREAKSRSEGRAEGRAEGEIRGEARAARKYEAQLTALQKEITRLKAMLV